MKRLTNIIYFLICTYGVMAQKIDPQVLSTAGTRFQGSTINIDWTLGEFAITTIKGSANIITQGFHQPNYVITKLNDLTDNPGIISVYPNPTSDLIQIKMTFDKVRLVQARLMDIHGKLIWNNQFKGQRIDETSSLKDLSNGIYILNFFIDDNQSTQAFKISKNF
jgi:hypothetical protein